MPRLLPLISQLFIVDKDAQLVRLGPVLKRDQLDLIARAQRQLDENGQIRLCILKARQIGMSTIIEAITFILSMLFDHMNGLVVSHEKESSTHILDMTRMYWDSYVFKRFYEERYNGRSHLAWDNHSDIHVATAGNEMAGRSTTLQLLHCSEVGFWDNAEILYNGLAQSVPPRGLNMIVFESTANGVGNFFHRQCMEAMHGDGDFEFVFYPWWNDPEYTIKNLPPKAQRQFSLLGRLDDEEQLLVKLYGLDEDRLLWRRWAIRNKAQGDLHKFHQEYPSSPHEAFISSGRNVFHLPNLLNHYVPRRGVQGWLRKVRGKTRFVEDPVGPLTVYAHPSDDTDWGVYLVGADPTHAPGGDYACAQVINRRTMEQVAVYRNNQTHPVEFAQHLMLLGAYYNRALLAPESTGPGFASVGAIVQAGYPMLYQRQHITKMQGISTADVGGWTTNVETKELAIAQLVAMVNEPIGYVGDEAYGLVIHDEITLMELRDYVKTEKGLGYGNSDGSEYDDGVMALAIAAAVHRTEPPPPPYVVNPESMMQRRRLTLPTHGTGAVILSDHDRLAAPTDIPVYAEEPENELPRTPPWEAWGRPREEDW